MLKDHKWNCNSTKIQVTNRFRNLGAHVNMTSTIFSSTLKERIKQTIIIIHKVARLPLSHKEKPHIVRTRCIPKALYAAEASLLNDA